MNRQILGVILVLAAGVLASAAQPPRPGTGLVPRIHSLLRDTFPAGKPGSAVIVARQGRSMFRRAYGLADAEFGVMLEPDMVFRVGSVTKQFTAALVLRMVERNELSLTAPVRQYLPDAPQSWRQITIEHLLSHTSGLPNYTALPEYRSGTAEDLTVRELVDRFRTLPLEFAPGTRFSYSNSGYVLAGAIVERVTGLAFAKAIREGLLSPLGLHHTHYDDPRRLLPRRARGYVQDGDELLNAPYLSMTQPYAAGALVSTLDDLVAWDNALSAGRVLNPASLGRMFAPASLAGGRSTEYGLGWALSEYEGRPVAEHGGGINGFRAHVIRVASERVFVAVLSNVERQDASPSRVARRIAALMLGSVGAEPKALELPTSALDQYEGTYRAADGAVVRLARQASGLVVSSGRTVSEFYPIAPDRFAERGGIERLEFRRDDEGRLAGYERSGWGRPSSTERQP